MRNCVVRNLVFVFVLAGIGLAPGRVFAKPDPLKRTVRADKELDVKKEIISFYRALISKNPQVKKRYNELIARAQIPGGPQVIISDKVQVIDWLVAERWWSRTRPDAKGHGELTYLIKQPLVTGSNDNYTSKGSIVAQISVVQDTTSIMQIEEDDEGPEKVKSAVMTLKFLGFVEIGMTAILPEGRPN